MITRRRFLAAAGTLAGSASVAAFADLLTGGQHAQPTVALGEQPAGLPARQHAWTATLARDAHGNAISPRFDRLLFLDTHQHATAQDARALEAVLRTLERRFPWSPSGLLFTVGWAPQYFERVLSRSSPIPGARAVSDFEHPAIDGYDLCLHLACDDRRRLADIEAALLHRASLAGADGPLDLSHALNWRETRTGFVGTGLPAQHQDVGGVPPGDPVSPKSPLYMGFKSGLRGNQASEDDVTIPTGAFAQGTTMQVSYMRLRLDSWYEQLDQRERVARMYGPQVTPAQAERFTTDAKSDPGGLTEAVRRYGVIGHAQTCARARRNNVPRIIRRDFDTVDGGQAGLHFVSLQRSIEDFIATREAMNASSAQLEDPAITGTVNNGINEFIFVLKRGNYLLPPRQMRSFPLLPDRAQAGLAA